MSTNDGIFQRTLSKLLTEIFDGPPGSEAYMLNPGDPGLLRQLDSVPARAASRRPMPGKTTIAAHVDHVHYGFTLLNRWVSGRGEPVGRRRLERELATQDGNRRRVANSARQTPPRSRGLAKGRRRTHRMGRHHRGRRAFQRRAHGVPRRRDPTNPGGPGECGMIRVVLPYHLRTLAQVGARWRSTSLRRSQRGRCSTRLRFVTRC